MEVIATKELTSVSVVVNDVVEPLEETSEGIYTAKLYAPKEAGTYKKISSLGKFGQGIEAQEQAIQISKENQKKATRDYFTGYGQDFLKYMGTATQSAQPVSFFNKNDFDTSNTPIDNFMKQVYNFNIPEGQDSMKIAMATNSYGYNFHDAIGLTE